MKIVLHAFVLIILLSPVTAIGQVSFSSGTPDKPSVKLSHSLLKKISTAEAMQEGNREIALFLRGDAARIKALVEELGGTYKYVAGTISVIRIPVSRVQELAKADFITWIEDNNLTLQSMNDRAVVNNHVQEVHAGVNLPQGYDGTGVVMGIIDEGIDWTHPDFRNLDGTTRIKYLWDQSIYTNNTSVIPQPFNYGMEYIGSQIDTATLTSDGSNGHGSHVAGIACGNGNALNNYKGMAPKSDIIIVRMNLNVPDNSFLSSLVDAVKYIFDKADSLHQPAVINISLGTYFGSHDGKDVQAESIAGLVDAQNGRVVVAAAGNAGTAPIHTGYTVTADTALTWYQFSSSYIYVEMWADSGNFEKVQFAAGLDRLGSPCEYIGGIPFTNISNILGFATSDTVWNSSHQKMGTIQHDAQLINGSYKIVFAFFPDSTDNTKYRWRIMTTGSGKFDAWSFDGVVSGLPDTIAMPLIKNYKKPDTNQNMVSSFQCNDNIITVASYANRNSYSNANFQQTYEPTLITGSLSPFSSHGPTRDGRTKPDITSTGDWVLSTGPYYVINGLLTVDPTKVAAGRMHFRSSGTSMASPAVAGICALYLQKNPSASWREVKGALISCADRDSFTGFNLPDNKWGYGKANAYSMIKGCLNDVDEPRDVAELSNYPNPFNGYTTITFRSKSVRANSRAEIRVSDVLGKTVRTVLIADAQIANSQSGHSVVLQREGLKSGIYFCSLITDGIVRKTSKLVVGE